MQINSFTMCVCVCVCVELKGSKVVSIAKPLLYSKSHPVINHRGFKRLSF